MARMKLQALLMKLTLRLLLAFKLLTEIVMLRNFPLFLIMVSLLFHWAASMVLLICINTSRPSNLSKTSNPMLMIIQHRPMIFLQYAGPRAQLERQRECQEVIIFGCPWQKLQHLFLRQKRGIPF